MPQFDSSRTCTRPCSLSLHPLTSCKFPRSPPGTVPLRAQLQVFLLQGVGSPQFTNFSNGKMIGFAFNRNYEPAILQLGNRISVRQRNQLPHRFQNCGSPIQTGLCCISRPEMVHLCCRPVNKRSPSCEVNAGGRMAEMIVVTSPHSLS